MRRRRGGHNSLDFDLRRYRICFAELLSADIDCRHIVMSAARVRHEVDEHHPREVPVLVDGVCGSELIALVGKEVLHARGVRCPERLCDDHRGIEDWPGGPLVNVRFIRGRRCEKRTGGTTVSTGSVKVADQIIMYL